jgi:hypothetical protein
MVSDPSVCTGPASHGATALHAGTSAWRSALDDFDALPRSFDLGLLAAVCVLVAAVRVTGMLRRRRARQASDHRQPKLDACA